MQRAHHVWHSESLNRPMDLLLFGHAGEPVILFPTSNGRFYQDEDFGLVGALADRIDAGRYLVACVDSVDGESWYNRAAQPSDRVLRHEQFEGYIVREVVPFVRARGAGGRLTLGGCSFGGFHTIQIGLRHPKVFQRLLSMSGKYETDGFLGGYHDDRVYFHSVFEWLTNLTDPKLLAELFKLEITLATGDRDMCKASNERLAALLWQKGIGNHLSVWRDADHDWPVWKQQIREYLP